jgi:hypothetical protein
LLINGRFLCESGSLAGAGIQPRAAGLTVVARFVQHVLPRAGVDLLGPDLLLLFIEQCGRLGCKLRSGAQGNKLFCACEVLQNSVGSIAFSQCVTLEPRYS